jgi:hypothetical protein
MADEKGKNTECTTPPAGTTPGTPGGNTGAPVRVTLGGPVYVTAGGGCGDASQVPLNGIFRLQQAAGTFRDRHPEGHAALVEGWQQRTDEAGVFQTVAFGEPIPLDAQVTSGSAQDKFVTWPTPGKVTAFTELGQVRVLHIEVLAPIGDDLLSPHAERALGEYFAAIRSGRANDNNYENRFTCSDGTVVRTRAYYRDRIAGWEG